MGVFSAGAIAAEYGILNGAVISLGGEPLTSAVFGVASDALRAGHALCSALIENCIGPDTMSEEDAKATVDATAMVSGSECNHVDSIHLVDKTKGM